MLEIRQILFSSKSCFPTGQLLLRAINVPCPSLFSHTQGKYELNLPFHQAKDKLSGSSPREIVWLLVPTHPEGSNCGWNGTLVGWVVSECGPAVHGTVDAQKLTHTHIRRCLWEVCLADQFILYECSSLLRVGPEGHQMGVKQTWTRGFVHTVCGEMGANGEGRASKSHANRNAHNRKKQSVRFMAREGFELEWSDLGAQILSV